ncbi:MAG: AMP-dependent synthetase/ligase [Spirochaetaceae bacterium]
MKAKTIPQLLKEQAEAFPEVAAQLSREGSGEFVARSYRDLFREVTAFAAGLHSLGVRAGSHVGLISENRKEWLVADLSVLSLGAADVPRGNDSMADEIAYILGFAECETVLVENEEQLRKVLSVREKIESLKTLVVLDPEFEKDELPSGLELFRYPEVRQRGEELLAQEPKLVERKIASGEADDTATIIFTSGTTGVPKGVMLSHHNFLHQVSCIPDRVELTPGDIWLCVLPVWHSFERIVQYIALGSATTLAYSKPIGKIMLEDMAAVRPKWMASVPRIWEAVRAGIYRNLKSQGGVKLALFSFFVAVGGAQKKLADMLRGLTPDFQPRSRFLDKVVATLPYLLLLPFGALGNILVFNKIRDRLGGRFVAGVSGGGALPPAVDQFFGAAGVLLLEGYGLTETAPVLAVRHQRGPVPGTVGKLLRETECRILGEKGESLPPGEMGVIYVRGPQVMKGYYKRPEATAEILDTDGWLNTGDLGMLTYRGELKITGRAKDTIVLLGGENIEPAPIEQKLQESEFIEQAVVVGQDQKYLGVLIVPAVEALEHFADENHIPYMDRGELIEEEAVRELMENEIHSRINSRNGFKSFEQIYRFALLSASFEIGDELSAKQEIKRHVIAKKYEREIAGLFR